MVPRGHVGRVECRDLKEKQVCKEAREMTERLVKREHRVTPAQPDPRDFPDLEAHQGYQEAQDCMARKVDQVCQEIPATKAVLDPKDLRASMEREARLVGQDRRERGVRLVLPDPKGHKDS